MKKYNTSLVVAGTLSALLLISMVFNFKFISLTSEQRATIKSLQAERNQVENYREALKLADDIMDNNDLWDRDGSDLMSDYLNLRANIDTTFYQGFHDNALLDNISNDYNE